MHGNLYTLSLGVGALILATSHAFAAPTCAPREGLARHLAERFGEARVGVGTAMGGTRMVEVYASEEGSWSIVVTDPRGVSCFMATGQNWEVLEEALPAAGIAG